MDYNIRERGQIPTSIDDAKQIFMLIKYNDNTEKKINLIGDSPEVCVINGLIQIGEIKNENLQSNTYQITLRNLKKFLNQSNQRSKSEFSYSNKKSFHKELFEEFLNKFINFSNLKFY